MGPESPDNPTDESFSCTVTVRPTYAMAYAHGDLDITTVGRLTAQLAPLAEAGGEIVVDLSDLSFLGSAGLRALAKLDEIATAAGGCLLLAGMPQFVNRLLRITGMDGQFAAADSSPERR
jgi:anti-sigma B factor antagonist